MDKLLIYTNINEIDFKQIEKKYDLIITSYSETAKLLDKKSDIKVISIGAILDRVFCTWNDRELDYSNIVQIRKILDESKYSSPEIVHSFTKSIDHIYDSIKEAKELRITTDEYKSEENTLEENLFLKIMEYMYIQDSFIDFDLKLFNYENDINTFKQDINSILNIDSSYDGFFKNKKILIQGFYYITPIQEIIFNYFKQSGINIDPMICYNNNYKAINKIVDNTFENCKKKELLNNNNKQNTYISDVYASLLDGIELKSSSIKDIDKLEFKHYKDLNIYNKDILKLLYDNNSVNTKKSINLYAVNRKEILNRISVFRGDLEEPDKLSIRYYPLGIFLKEIYSTWNPKNNSVCITIELLSRIFECNILEIEKNVKSSEYIEDLNKMNVYFADCITIEEWISRIEKLINNRSNINMDNRNKTLVDYYGPFSINQSRLDNIKEFLIKLKQITDIIFFDKKGNVDTDIIIHLNNLYDIVQKNTDIDSDEDNKSIGHQLLIKIHKILENKKDKNLSSARNEYLFRALNLYINDVKKCKEAIKRKKDICPLDSIEAIDEGIDEVNIYDFDREHFPQFKFKELLFLNKDKLKKIILNREDGSIEKNIANIYLKLLNSNELIGRYVFWLMLNNTNVNKNIYRLEEDTDNKHFYQYILEHKLEKESIEVTSTLEEKKIDINVDLKKYKINSNNINKDLKGKYLYMYCPLRAYFVRINDNRELYVEKLSVEHFIPSAIANIYNENNNAFSILEGFNQYSSVMQDRLKGVAIHNIREYNNNYECFWLPNNLKIKNQRNMKNENIEYLYAYYRYRNSNIKAGLIPKPNSGKSTCTYCSFKYICVEKDLNSINFPSKYWRNKQENYKHLEKAKKIMK